MTELRALVFDFDGVILESNQIKTRAFERVYQRFPDHAAAMMAYHDAHVSESRYQQFRHLVVDRLGLDEHHSLMQELVATFSNEVLAAVATCPAVPGALEMLAALSGQVPLFLASVTPQVDLDETLACRGLTSFFSRVYGCPPWTKVRAFEEIGRLFDGAEGLAFIGDSAGDQRAAKESGVDFYARDSGLAFDEPRPLTYPDLFAVFGALGPRLPAHLRTTCL